MDDAKSALRSFNKSSIIAKKTWMKQRSLKNLQQTIRDLEQQLKDSEAMQQSLRSVNNNTSDEVRKKNDELLQTVQNVRQNLIAKSLKLPNLKTSLKNSKMITKLSKMNTTNSNTRPRRSLVDLGRKLSNRIKSSKTPFHDNKILLTSSLRNPNVSTNLVKNKMPSLWKCKAKSTNSAPTTLSLLLNSDRLKRKTTNTRSRFPIWRAIKLYTKQENLVLILRLQT